MSRDQPYPLPGEARNMTRRELRDSSPFAFMFKWHTYVAPLTLWLLALVIPWQRFDHTAPALALVGWIGGLFPHVDDLVHLAQQVPSTDLSALQLVVVDLLCLTGVIAELSRQRRPVLRLMPRLKLLGGALCGVVLLVPFIGPLMIWDSWDPDGVVPIVAKGEWAVIGAIIFGWWCVLYLASWVLGVLKVLVRRHTPTRLGGRERGNTYTSCEFDRSPANDEPGN